MNAFFIHIGKCGGMSIREMLKQHYGADNSYDIVDIFTRWDKNNHKAAAGFYGHATIYLKELLPQPLYIFTMLRDPAERILSYWKHMKREGPEIHTTNAHLLAMEFTDAIQHPDFNRLNNGMVKALSLNMSKEYETLYKNVYYKKMDFTHGHNNMVKHLNNSDDGIDIAYCDINMLNTAVKNLSNIRFGFQENYEEDIQHVFEPLNFIPNMVKTNYAPKKQSDIILTIEQKQILKKTNKYDYMLYEYAKDLYKENTNVI